MSSVRHQEFVRRAEGGEIFIGIEPDVARRFFTDTHHEAIQREIGEALFVERFFVKAVWLLEYISLLAGVVLSIFALRWYSAIAIPLMIMGCFVLGGMASAGAQKLNGTILFALICFLTAYYVREQGRVVILWFILLPLPYLFARLTYKFSTVFLRALSVRNERVFDLLYDKGIFLKEVKSTHNNV